MKNLKFNLPVIAMLLGLCIVFTQSAFKTDKKLLNVYGYNYTTGQWIPENPNYTCKYKPTLICKFKFKNVPLIDETPFNTSAQPMPDRGTYVPID
ncbi:hypothetical protein HDF26_001276 [Pedobacter cryoconitis]|uniref:DUF6520 family protein n=1 Tax=Pedobacter cryoconitis TaxID=188932 RepID=UPI0016140123|nr:DUF6520 family protein [Pedobacter cryoconitis]MBB6270849.1 hypothetical protein [Pedobacter cryoconitis]